MTSSERGRGQLRGNGYVTGLVATLPQGTLAEIQGLRNGGVITAEGDYLNPPNNWSSTSGKAQLWFDGNYVQEASGVLKIAVTDENRSTAPAPRIPVRLSGHAFLDGKLQVDHEAISAVQGTLTPGDRYHLMEWEPYRPIPRILRGDYSQPRRCILRAKLHGRWSGPNNP